ncbi:MAG: putative polysaccharide biosynthesis protein [Bacillota bacterium]
MKAQSFLRGTVVLVAAGIVTKVLGALFTIPLTRLIGAEGVGLLHMASPVFVTALVLCVSGIPVATSKLAAERLATGDRPGARQVLLVSLALMLPVGTAFSLALYAGAGFITTFIVKDPRAFFPLRYLAPAVAVVSVSSVLRGYFQGHRTMVPTGTSHVLEQIVRVAVGLGLAYLFLPRGVQWAAAGSAMGSLAGAAAGLALLVVFFLVTERQDLDAGGRRPLRRALPGKQPEATPPATAFETAKRLVSLAAPVTLAALVGPLLEALNAIIVPARLQFAGFSVVQSTELYGRLSVMALSLVALPGVAAAAIATSLVPQVAAAYAGGKLRRGRELARQAVRSALVVGIPATVGLAVLPAQICAFLFGDPGGGVPLSAMAFSSVFFCLQQTTAGVLNGIGKVHIPAMSGLAGALVAALVNFILTGMPEVGIRGAALGTGLGFLVAGVLNTLAVGGLTGDGIRIFGVGWRALLGSAAMAPLVAGVYRALLECTYSNAVSTVAGILAGIAAYGFALIVLGELSCRELALIPFVGRPLARLLLSATILRK